MNIRSVFFNLIDTLKGAPISKNLKEIRAINELTSDTAIHTYQNQKLSKLLKIASSEIPYYKQIKSTKIEDFPIVDKTVLKEKLNELTIQSKPLNKLSKVVTSGSTGTPFVSYRDKNKTYRNSADALYFGGLAGYRLGEPLFYLKIWSEGNRKSKRTQIIQNIIPIDVIQLSGNTVEEFISKLNKDYRNVHINGYASSLEEVCKYLDKYPTFFNSNSLNVNSIIAQSEALNDETKIRLRRHFNCTTACSRYSNVEKRNNCSTNLA